MINMYLDLDREGIIRFKNFPIILTNNIRFNIEEVSQR
jgi:hypothetical protein